MNSEPDRTLGSATDSTEQELRNVELELKKLEVEAARKRVNVSRLQLTPVGVSLIVGIAGGLAALLGNWYQGQVNIKLERQKFESSQKLERQRFESVIILKAVETPRATDKARNLLFFVDAGLIGDDQNKIRKLASKPQDLPSVPRAAHPYDIAPCRHFSSSGQPLHPAGDVVPCTHLIYAADEEQVNRQ